MNRETAVRKAFYEAIKTLAIVIPGDNTYAVPVYDSKTESNESFYVIIATQTAQWDGDFVLYKWRANIDIEIYHLQQESATFDIVDLISDEIEKIVLNTMYPTGSGVVQQAGWDIHNVFLQSANSFKMKGVQSGTEMQKVLTFSSIIIKQ